MGTPDFAVPTLEALVAAGHRLVAAYCQPPRPAGRGHRIQPAPVQRAAMRLGIPVRHPKTLRDPGEQAAFAALDLDAAVVVAYGLILPKAILQAPRLGCINVHASLLPRWRGAAPIQRALLAGDAETGVTIMQMDEGLDTGPILLGEAIAVAPDATARDLHDRLAALGARLAVDALAGLAAGALTPRPQQGEGVAYAAKLAAGEGRLDWRRPADELDRAVRALNPWPGTWCEIGPERIKVLAAEAVPGRAGARPGTVLDERLAVACGTGALRPTRLQRPSRPAADVDAFLRGYPVAPGTLLPCPATS